MVRNDRYPKAFGYVMIEAQGELERKLTGDASHDRHPAWSPDGEQIIYVSNQGE